MSIRNLFLAGLGFLAAAYAAPPVPVLISPAHNATGLPRTDTLTWAASAGTATYRVQLSTDSTFATTTLNDSTVTGTTRVTPLLANNTVYYWRVNAKDSTGTSAFSVRQTFTVILATPSAPTLSFPPNNTTNLAPSINLNWTPATGAATYRVQLSADSTFTTTTVDDSTVTGITLAVGPLASGTVYYWRVNAKNAGGTSAFSTRRTFTVVAPPTVPVLNTPANNATGVAISSNLTWSAINGAATYRVQLSADSTFATTIIDDSSVASTTRATGTLANNTLYYWRVNGKNAVGTSAFSTIRTFTTLISIPAAPTLSNPANNATGRPLNDTLKWNASAGATSYRVQFSTDSTFSNVIFFSPLLDDSTVTATSQSVGPLTNGTTYYWRVNAKNSAGTGAFSARRAFSTQIALPAVPTLSGPASNATALPLIDTLRWNVSTGAATYRVQLSPDTAFATLVVNDSTLITTTKVVGPLTNGTTYYWRINAKNAAGISAFSTRRAFTTLTPIPSAPALSSPANNATDLPLTDTLRWTAVTGALSYRVQLSTNASFADLVVNDSSITGTARIVSSLTNGTVYYWRVQARNAGGTGTFSEVGHFTTTGPASIFLKKSIANGFDGNSLRFSLAHRSLVKIALFDSRGKQTLKILSEVRDPGLYNLPLPTQGLKGWYLLDFQSEGIHKTLKLAL